MSRSFPDSVQAAGDECAAEYGVSGRLHPDDFILWFILDKPGPADGGRRAVAEYFESGRAGAIFAKSLLAEECVRAALDQRADRSGPVAFLDFAAGYGRIARHLPVVAPELRIAACDIHPQAVEFLGAMGLDAALSAHDPDAFDLGRHFDVVFAFSFFTHLPRATWRRWLAVLARHLAPSGVLIFTTHGETSQRLMGIPTLEEDGFFFHAVSEQADLDAREYGNTVTTFPFVYAQAQAAGLRLLQYRESGAGHHDLYILGEARGDAPVSEDPRILAERNGRLVAEIRALRASTSWRVTGPLRAVRGLLRPSVPPQPA